MFSASLSGTNPETIYIFSHEATAQFISDYSENYNGFNATYTAFNANELNSKCSFCVCVFVCYPECLVKLYFQFDKMEMKREAVFSGLSTQSRSHYFKDQITDFSKTVHRFTGLYLAVG